MKLRYQQILTAVIVVLTTTACENQMSDRQIVLRHSHIVLQWLVLVLFLSVIAILIFFLCRIQKQNYQLHRAIKSLKQLQPLSDIKTASATEPQQLTDDEDLQNYLKMESLINEQKVFLNPLANIDMVMEKAGYSRRTSTRLIQQFGNSNTRLDYLNQKRVVYAAQQLLADLSASTKEVGARSGFYDDSTFRRNFKKYYGVTPAAFRTLHGAGGAEAPD
ncbi:AraC family transcriptional regulator [Xylanibacter brevis]|uniref:AraC family transcriptional regulator n=1 Tax=Xylanibacter brevis TaxID=83231 RepID=UPI0004849AFE|nr:helix-turn-helix domain-containing protein [Xylanibacter brevis]